MGSLLVGPAKTISKARHARKLFGGALRQAGIVAAAAIYALDQHVDRLAEDHANARQFAEGIAAIEGISVDLEAVETNLVFFEIDPRLGDGASFSRRLADRNLKMYDLGPQMLRACTHLDVGPAEIDAAVERIRQIAGELAAGG